MKTRRHKLLSTAPALLLGMSLSATALADNAGTITREPTAQEAGDDLVQHQERLQAALATVRGGTAAQQFMAGATADAEIVERMGALVSSYELMMPATDEAWAAARALGRQLDGALTVRESDLRSEETRAARCADEQRSFENAAAMLEADADRNEAARRTQLARDARSRAEELDAQADAAWRCAEQAREQARDIEGQVSEMRDQRRSLEDTTRALDELRRLQRDDLVLLRDGAEHALTMSAWDEAIRRAGGRQRELTEELLSLETQWREITPQLDGLVPPRQRPQPSRASVVPASVQ